MTASLAMSRGRFDPPARSEFANFLTRSPYFLVRADCLPVTAQRLEEITAICNEPEVYDWLFRERFNGKPYASANASEFLDWCAGGWREQSHFVFLVTTVRGQVAAACDIKSNSVGAEVGYWASSRHRGVMTNAVVTMCVLARDAGFNFLTARTKKLNERSVRVLARAGFATEGSSDLDFNRFRLNFGP